MCKKQQPIVDRLSTDAKYAKVAVFRADFDKDKELLKQMKVSKQGTLIAFKGKNEKTRTVGDTDEPAIRNVFEAAL
jgi:hypothetical protein